MSQITNVMIREAFEKAMGKYEGIFSTDRWGRPSLSTDQVTGSNNAGYRFYINVPTPQGTLKLSATTAAANDSIVSVHLSSQQSSSYWSTKAKEEASGTL